jgi:Flp pilus assembly protein TadD
MNIRQRPARLVALALVCVSALYPLYAAEITPDDLLAGTPLDVSAETLDLVEDGDVLAVSPEMEAFLDAYVQGGSNEFLRFRQLAYAIINEKTFGLEYDEKTRTASETFRLRRGNCLSFSNMFVAMARGAGLDAEFQEVDIPPDWTFRNDAFVLNRHVNVVVDLGTSGVQAVDFNMDDFKTSYDRWTIPDRRAMAHFYNNLGVESLNAGDTAAALAYFRRAIADHDRRFAPAWTNLGILYLREGHLDFAEAAFLQALSVKSKDLVAMSNLANFYENHDQPKQAEIYHKKVIQHRRKNPYYRYFLAREAFLSGDYDEAIKHLKYAIRKRQQEDQFFFLLGLSYLQQGNKEAARTWLDRAEETAASDALKRDYSNKIDMLLSAPN